ncbi:uncharacterized protein FA14DRAFT_29896 [Meira miltonrushii]|uniref:Uncharacterized protein n=1 Tax=Meira miltonrushii TaxID=1280837 RepID=A0A316V415_9BASI|nr:uncharacterized protein FA14DRAFT_29896 [Meira miltonrushii]PWN31261.1 hypothetical protein FA14DRAFT_29896 [Meira miltonrushii]
MFASKSSHKRKRSAARRNTTQKGLKVSHSIISSCKVENGIDSGSGKLEEVIDSHVFNHQTNIILPFTQNTDHLSNNLPSSQRVISYSARINIQLFLDPLFLISYIKRGTLSLLSVGNLDSEDVICINGKGQLVLSLCKETYYELGIQGQALKASKGTSGRAADRRSGTAERFVVIVDLLATSFEPGKDGYESIAFRLSAWDSKRAGKSQNGSWNVVMNWCSAKDSFGDKIEFPKKNVIADSIKRVPIELSRELVTDSWLPTQESANDLAKGWSENIGHDRMQWIVWHDALVERLAWASMNILDCDCTRTFWRSDDLHLNSRKQSFEPGKLIKITYTGFLPSSLGNCLIAQIQHLLDETTPNLFAIVQSVGFADAPICWSLRNKTILSYETEKTTKLDRSSSSETDFDEADQTGRKARRKRNKNRKKRGFVDRNQHGHQTRNESSICTASGWQTILSPTKYGDEKTGNCFIIENIGDSQRS